jgi:hypothetical protein
MRLARATAAVLAASLLAGAVEGQIASPAGTIHGTVLDEQRRPVSGAEVTLDGPDFVRTTTTDAHGDFRFLNAAPGKHTLALKRGGFQSVRRELLVQAGKNVVLDVTTPVAGVEERVTVLAPEPSQDTRKVETGATQDQRELAAIPTTRDPWGVLRQVPGVLVSGMDVGGGSGEFPEGFVGKGTRGHQNTINLDGVSLSIAGFSPFLFDFDSFDSIGVSTGGSDPSRATAGVSLNLVTKSGTNRLLGSARGLYTGGSQWEYGLEAGGPLWKDRLWLWAAGASNSFLGQTFFLPDGEPVRSQESHTYWNGKLTGQLVPSNTFTLSYMKWKRTVDGRGADPLVSEESTWDVDFPGQSYKIEDSHVFSEKLFATLYLSYVPISRDAIPKGGVDAQVYVDADSVVRNSEVIQRGERSFRQGGLTASTFFGTGSLGHELKVGFGYRNHEIDSSSIFPANQLAGAADVDPFEARVTREMVSRSQIETLDAYLSDTITTGNLTVSLGARFDYQRSRNRPSAVGANPVFPDLLPAVSYGGDTGYPMEWHSVQPRVGATYALGQDRRTLLRASYARFADELGFEVSEIGAFPGMAVLAYPWDDANQNGIVEPSEIDVGRDNLIYPENVNPDDPGSSASVNRLSPDLQPPETDEWILGVERQISPHLTVSLAYTHHRLTGPLFSPLIGTTRASYQYLANASGTITDPNTGFTLEFSEPYYGLTTDPPPYGIVLENRPDTAETYDGVELQLVKSLSDGWMLRVGFSYNNWRQEIGPGAIVDPNNLVPGTNAGGPLVDGNVNAAWQFNVSGVAQLPLGVQAGVNLFGRQGFPILYFVRALTNDVLFSQPELQIGSATDYRTPNVYQLDLQLSRDFQIGSRIVVTPIVTFLNLLDSRTVLAREGFVGQYDTLGERPFEPNRESFNAVAEELSPRTIRGGVRVIF